MIGIAVLIITILTIVCTPLFVLGSYLDKKHCMKAYSAFNPSFTITGGCMVDFNGKRIPIDIIKEVNLN